MMEPSHLLERVDVPFAHVREYGRVTLCGLVEGKGGVTSVQLVRIKSRLSHRSLKP